MQENKKLKKILAPQSLPCFLNHIGRRRGEGGRGGRGERGRRGHVSKACHLPSLCDSISTSYFRLSIYFLAVLICLRPGSKSAVFYISFFAAACPSLWPYNFSSLFAAACPPLCYRMVGSLWSYSRFPYASMPPVP